MGVRRLVIVGMVVMALAACRRGESTITGGYGAGVLAGQVVLDGIEGSPEEVEVSVRGTGMRTVLSADGKFVFSGVPANATLDFRRGDGIDASLAVNGNGSLLVQLSRSKASKGSGRDKKTKDKVEFEGEIVSANADEIVMRTSHREEILIGLSQETVIRRGNEILTADDLEAGMHVHVRARKLDHTYTAQHIVVQGDDDDGEGEERPELRQYEGTIVSVSETELVINDSHRNEVTFVLTLETDIRKGNTPVAPSDLLPGQRVHVKATVADDGTATAVQVTVQNTRVPTVNVSGTVLGVAGSDITVETKKGTVTVQTNASTRFHEKGKTISLSDIEAGETVKAKGTEGSANTILATEVEVHGKKGHP